MVAILLPRPVADNCVCKTFCVVQPKLCGRQFVERKNCAEDNHVMEFFCAGQIFCGRQMAQKKIVEIVSGHKFSVVDKNGTCYTVTLLRMIFENLDKTYPNDKYFEFVFGKPKFWQKNCNFQFF